MKTNELYELIEVEKPQIICFDETKISYPFIDVQKE
jgi:hypothetical protein